MVGNVVGFQDFVKCDVQIERITDNLHFLDLHNLVVSVVTPNKCAVDQYDPLPRIEQIS